MAPKCACIFYKYLSEHTKRAKDLCNNGPKGLGEKFLIKFLYLARRKGENGGTGARKV